LQLPFGLNVPSRYIFAQNDARNCSTKVNLRDPKQLFEWRLRKFLRKVNGMQPLIHTGPHANAHLLRQLNFFPGRKLASGRTNLTGANCRDSTVCIGYD